MVTIKNQKLIIEIDTPIPEEHLEGLKLGITEALQVQFRDEVEMPMRVKDQEAEVEAEESVANMKSYASEVMKAVCLASAAPPCPPSGSCGTS